MTSPPRKKRRQPTGAAQIGFNERSIVAHRSLQRESGLLATEGIKAIQGMTQFLHPLKQQVDALLIEEMVDPIRFQQQRKNELLLEKTFQLEQARQNYMEYRQNLSNYWNWWEGQYQGIIQPGLPPIQKPNEP